MKVLDLYCGAGGASEGYRQAGFDQLVGIDINLQPRYPFEFRQGDAIEAMEDLDFLRSFDLIHASPPCQRFSKMTKRWGDQAIETHPDLIGMEMI